MIQVPTVTGIVCVTAAKGGVGKTTLAYELAACLDGVLIDLDWDAGSASGLWGYDHERYKQAPLIDGFERGPQARAPRPKRRPHRPALLPAHPDLGACTVSDELVADCLLAWRKEWGSPWVVIDTHPGGNPLAEGAMSVANLVVIPVVLGNLEIRALEGQLKLLDPELPLLLVPHMVPPTAPPTLVRRLQDVTEGRAALGPLVSEHRWRRRRLRQAAVVLQPNPSRELMRAADEYRQVAQAVKGRV